MEETLKLILEKISALNEGQIEINKKISSLEQGQQEMKQDVSAMKQDISKISTTIENTIESKISALFDARDISLKTTETTQTVVKDIKEIKEDVALLKNAITSETQKNKNDIVALKDYRKEN